MPTQVQLAIGDVQAAPLTYTVPPAQSVEPVAVNATFDGSAAAGAFLPTLEIVSDSGHVVARCIVDSTVAAGGSAEVTFAPFLRRGGSGTPSSGTSGYASTVSRLGPEATWPLDETSGTTAHDATGNGHDLAETVFAGGSITWDDSASPPGTGAPRFAGTDSGFFAHPAAALAQLTDNFAVAVWVNYDAAGGGVYDLIGEGLAPYRAGVVKGWALVVQPGAPLVQVWFGDGAAAHSLSATTNPLAGAWFHVGFQSDGGTKTLWVNGAQQAATSAAVLAAALPNEWWIGYDFPFGLATPADTMKGLLAWAVRVPRPLTAAEWVSLASSSGGVPEGWLLQSDGAGSSFFGPFSSDAATAGQVLTADGAGGTYWA